ncbi:hypothetical protein UCRPA7_4369 [Phaeoacremonium minimum UCRPA7]|uniref:Uncharacterized protein n=1 Tax=Phaeoacremonium minimum (strain UCR-PA7) TaxID=1286976 RepID=R8BLA5_PHAM7|nr:hypothetical protein UCRPA7_4369 [Phaeoacremonium minimum UCRPA7]EOO00143.1 hypothetical protein UCRPA7_4369 [Phaeoacremonium minimum UCRPA7]
MKVFTTFTLLLLTAFRFSQALAIEPSIGFVLPRGLPDGSYTVARDTNHPDKHIFTNINTRESYESTKTDRLARREEREALGITARTIPNGQIGCTFKTYDHNDWQAARDAFETDILIFSGSPYVVTRGNAMLYMCAYKTNPTSQVEYDEANSKLDRQCGSWMGGYYWIQNWDKTYGRDNVAAQICS